MRNNHERGDFIEWLLTLLALSVVIFAILIPKSGRNLYLGFPDLSGGWNFLEESNRDRTNSQLNTAGEPSNPARSARPSGSSIPSIGIPGESSSPGSIRISTGNAKYEKDPMSEYITLENRGGEPVNITGWRLENGKSARVYSVGNQPISYASDTAIIPQGAKIISPIGANILENIILMPNERAVIVTGGPGNQTPKLVSFKENLCTGYLEEIYKFPVNLSNRCVRPANEPGVTSLDTQCRSFVSSLPSCETPEYGSSNPRERCDGCVNGKSGLSGMCIDYIRSHFSYKGCLANHAGDPGFEGKVWYVYLHRPWEMWDSAYEKISLYNSFGQLVTELSY